MAWTAPMTFAPNTVLTAAQLNIHLRDNMLETSPAKATTPGSYFVTSSANSIMERVVLRQTFVTTAITTSTSYGDLESSDPLVNDGAELTGPEVTAITGTTALVIWGCEMWHSESTALNSNTIRMAVEVTGATSLAPSDIRSVCNATPGQGRFQGSHAVWFDDLVPGANTFTARYRVSANTGNYSNRRLIVLPY